MRPNNTIPPSKTRRKHQRPRNPFDPRHADNHGLTIMLRLDQRQHILAAKMAKAQDELPPHLMEYRDDLHIEKGTFPSLKELTTASRQWQKSTRVLPQGAVEATAKLVLKRCIEAAKDFTEPDWDHEPRAVYFSGGGAKQYIKVKNRKIWLPKLGWCPYFSKKQSQQNKGDVLAAVLEAPGTRIKGATLRRSAAGDYRVILSFQRAPDQQIRQQIAEKAPDVIVRWLREEGMSKEAAEQRMRAKYIEPVERAKLAEALATPFQRALRQTAERLASQQGLGQEDAEKLVYDRFYQQDAAIVAAMASLGYVEPVEPVSEIFRLFKKPSGGFHPALAVSTVKKAVTDYTATSQLLRDYRVRQRVVRIGQRVVRGYRLEDITSMVNRYYSGSSP